jgi:hypothetical protein
VSIAIGLPGVMEMIAVGRRIENVAYTEDIL